MVVTSMTATDKQIRHLLGPSSDDIVAAIRKTGATAAEILEAFEWRWSSEYRAQARRQPASGRIETVYRILMNLR